MINAAPASPATFGEMLKFLRKRAHLTQRELGFAVGYSETLHHTAGRRHTPA